MRVPRGLVAGLLAGVTVVVVLMAWHDVEERDTGRAQRDRTTGGGGGGGTRTTAVAARRAPCAQAGRRRPGSVRRPSAADRRPRLRRPASAGGGFSRPSGRALRLRDDACRPTRRGRGPWRVSRLAPRVRLSAIARERGRRRGVSRHERSQSAARPSVAARAGRGARTGRGDRRLHAVARAVEPGGRDRTHDRMAAAVPARARLARAASRVGGVRRR